MNKTPAQQMQEIKMLLEFQDTPSPLDGGIPEGLMFFGAIEVRLGTHGGKQIPNATDMPSDSLESHADGMHGQSESIGRLLAQLMQQVGMHGHEFLPELVHRIEDVAAAKGYDITDGNVLNGELELALHGVSDTEGEKIALEMLRCGKTLSMLGNQYLANQQAMGVPPEEMLSMQVNGWLNVINEDAGVIGVIANHAEAIGLSNGQTNLSDLVHKAIRGGHIT